jgi:hypothetical protein
MSKRIRFWGTLGLFCLVLVGSAGYQWIVCWGERTRHVEFLGREVGLALFTEVRNNGLKNSDDFRPPRYERAGDAAYFGYVLKMKPHLDLTQTKDQAVVGYLLPTTEPPEWFFIRPSAQILVLRFDASVVSLYPGDPAAELVQ